MSEYVQIMKKHQLKQTKQRELVFGVLERASSPINAEAIYAQLLDSQINLSTIYRVLEIFVEKGIVLKSMIGKSNASAFELNHQEHKHHLVCVKCHSIVAIKGCPLGKYVEQLANQSHYEILEHKLEILGVCPSCQHKHS